jgi:hypothetical protein
MSPHQPADPWQGGSLVGCGRENGKRAETALPLLDAEMEGDMAPPLQSELGLGLDRRQLLAGTAVVTAAGIVPNVEAAEVVNSGEAASGPKTWVSENSALNVCAATARRIEEITARNKVRNEAGLPLLSIPRELRRMKQAADAVEFEEFAAMHRQAVWDEVLAPGREARGEDWRPQGLMQGNSRFKRKSAISCGSGFAPPVSQEVMAERINISICRSSS